ncbi:S1 family peptidase [Streptomyces sp. NPDC093225]|uniref:S1 family peptidase n=1 Tax=Streptomyces sp. NPDC093225 TaxID=3366034 RepID=UPI0037F46DE8
MFSLKSLRSRAALSGATAALAAGLVATMAAPAGAAAQPAAQPDSSASVTAQMASVINAANKGNNAPERDAQIIGGTAVNIKNYPFMTQLWVGDGQGHGWFCSGSVVNSRKILTAAHCVKGKNFVKYGFVITGATRIADSHSLYGGKMYSISKQWYHPRYNSSTFANDIAVLTLKSRTSAKPAKVTTSTDTASYRPGKIGTSVGWGRTTSKNQNLSTYLRRGYLPVQANSVCQRFWGTGFKKGAMLCVGKAATGSDRGTVATCNGDSGGPFLVNGRIVGVTSWGVKDCVYKGAHPVFTKYSTYAKTVAAQLR